VAELTTAILVGEDQQRSWRGADELPEHRHGDLSACFEETRSGGSPHQKYGFAQPVATEVEPAKATADLVRIAATPEYERLFDLG
jgi:hypothetical protein